MTDIHNTTNRYIAEILNDISPDLKKSLLDYLKDQEVFARLQRKLEISAVLIESENVRINLFSKNELGCLRDFLEIEM